MQRKRYIVQESGSITIPAEFRRKYDLNAGDEVEFVETEDGLLITPRQTLVRRLLDDIGDELEAKGVSLEELMQAGRGKRTELLKKLYDIDAEA